TTCPDRNSVPTQGSRVTVARCELLPVPVRGGDRLEVDGDNLRARDECVGILRVHGTQFVAHLSGGLGHLYADAGHLHREVESVLRGCGDQAGQPGVGHDELLTWGVVTFHRTPGAFREVR